MCYKAPGPRCSSHAMETLISKKKDFTKAESNLVTHCGHMGESEEFDAQTQVLLHKMSAAHDEVAAAQFVYDSTPAGQKKLDIDIAVGQEQGVDTSDLKTRRFNGKASRNKQIDAVGVKNVFRSLSTKELQAGDVLVGSGFTVSRRPFRMNGQKAGKICVEGSYPGKTPKMYEWNPSSQILVDRDDYGNPEEKKPESKITTFNTIQPEKVKTSPATLSAFRTRWMRDNDWMHEAKVNGEVMTVKNIELANCTSGEEQKAEVVLEKTTNGYTRTSRQSMTLDEFDASLNQVKIDRASGVEPPRPYSVMRGRDDL